MSAEAILSLFGGASGGTAIVFCVLFITGQIYSKKSYDEMREDRDEWKRTAELERARAEAGVAAAQLISDAWRGLRRGAGADEVLQAKEG